MFSGYVYYIRKIKNGDLRKDSEQRNSGNERNRMIYIPPNLMVFLVGIVIFISNTNIIKGSHVLISIFSMIISMLLLFFVLPLFVPFYCLIKFPSFTQEFNSEENKKEKR